MKKYIIVLFIISFLCGCGSINARRNDDYVRMNLGIYPSTRENARWLTSMSSHDYDSLLTGAEPLIVIMATLDMPIALAVDTIFVPIDLVRDKSNMRTANNLLNKHLPGFELVRNDRRNDEKEAFFYLRSPQNEIIELSNIRNNNGEYISNDEINEFLRGQSIKVRDSEDAIDLVKLVLIIEDGNMISNSWNVEAKQENNAWLITITDKAQEKVRLGPVWELTTNEKLFEAIRIRVMWKGNE